MSKKQDTIKALNALGIEGLVVPEKTELTQGQLDMILSVSDKDGLPLELFKGMTAQIEVQDNAKEIAALSGQNERLAARSEVVTVNYNKKNYLVLSNVRIAGNVYTKKQIAENADLINVKDKEGVSIKILDYITALEGNNILKEE